MLGAALLAVMPLRADTNLVVPTDTGSNVTIKLSSPALSVPRFGFLPVRVSIENLTTRDGVWTFRFAAGGGGMFPGVASSTFEIAVPAPQTREMWFFVPLAEPGLSVNPAAMTPVSPLSSSAAPLPSWLAPPTITDVYPTSPPGVAPPRIAGTRTTSNPSGLVRTYTIEQSGPMTALPQIPASNLPPNTTMTITPPNAGGQVTRTTVVSVDASRSPTTSFVGGGGGSGATGSFFPTIINNARLKLAAASLSPPGVNSRSSASSTSTSIPGATQYTVAIVQTGSAAVLTLPDVKSLPPGFTSVAVNATANPGEVTREFVYVENVVTAPPPGTTGSLGSTAPTAVANSPLMARGTAESEARRILAPTSLLTTRPSVRTSVSMRSISISTSAGASGGGIPPSPPPMVMFEQTGPLADLPVSPFGNLPPGVLVTLHPGVGPSSTTRIITVVEPTLLASMRAAAVAASSGSNISDRLSFARTELMRLGYLRGQPNVQQGTQTRYSSGTPGPGGPDLYILTESGPPNLLPPVGAGVLPPGITSSVTQGPLPGEVSRNFIVNFAALLAPTGSAPIVSGGTTVGVVTLPAVTARRAARGPGGLPPTPLNIEVTGPGITQARLSFPMAAANALPPMAISPTLEATLRSKLVAASIRTVPNLAPVDPAQLPADWRVWSSFNSVLLRSDDFSALDAGRRAALRGWVALGGTLYLSPWSAGTAATENFGAGRIETLSAPLADLYEGSLASALPLNTLSPALPDRDLLRLPANSAMGDIVKFEAPDILWLSIFLIAFAVVVGPVNLFLLAPAAKRHRLFWTTPLLSLGGAAAVAGAIVLQDGLGGEGVRRAVVVLVPGDNQAAVFQEQAARTGFLTGSEFALDDNVLCTVVPVDDNATVASIVPAQFSRDRGQATGDWFRNRSRQAQLLRNLVPTRSRVELVDTAVGGAPIVESTLATELRNFRLRDDGGKFWTAESVGPGRRVTLRADTRVVAAIDSELKAAQETLTTRIRDGHPDVQGQMVKVRDLTVAAELGFSRNGTPNLGDILSAVALRGAWQWSGRGGATDLAPIRTHPGIRWQDDDVVYAGVATRGLTTARGAAPRNPASAPAVEKGGQ